MTIASIILAAAFSALALYLSAAVTYFRGTWPHKGTRQ